MGSRPGWNKDYWQKLDKETEKKLRTSCPKCGSTNTYYNKQFGTWRCGKCEHSYFVAGYGNKVPFWKRLFGLR